MAEQARRSLIWQVPRGTQPCHPRRLDDVIGWGFVLIARSPLPTLKGRATRLLDELEVRAIDLTSDGTADLDGRYELFMDRYGLKAMIIRPDFHVPGGVSSIGEVGELPDALNRAIPYVAQPVGRSDSDACGKTNCRWTPLPRCTRSSNQRAQHRSYWRTLHASSTASAATYLARPLSNACPQHLHSAI